MICFLWIIFPSLASMAQAGGSGSAEVVKAAAGAKGGVGNAAGGNGANPGILNGIVMNGQLPQLVPVGALLLQQPGGAMPMNQGAMQVLPGPGVQPGMTFPLAFALPQQQLPQQQQQLQLPQQQQLQLLLQHQLQQHQLQQQQQQQQPGLPQGQNQPQQTAVPVFAVLPQMNGMAGMGGLQFPWMAAGQQMQFLSLGAANLQQGAGGGQGQGQGQVQGQGGAAKARVKHSVSGIQEPLSTTSEPAMVMKTPTMRPMSLAERLKLSVTPQRKSA
ncbi:serine/threonine-protein kinase Wnk-like [Sardina pilchardus]|uniref:serine/threonine-protein kinase Wnk-like n=1 Tax=Sardina pilchardus TaxID=27697 RepID=UPI002E13C31A